jgi:hypothetical protein
MDQISISIEEVKTKIKLAFINVQFPGDENLLRSDSQDESEIEGTDLPEGNSENPTSGTDIDNEGNK